VILADTSVWVDHLRRHNSDLAERLGAQVILGHPFVIGELACGNLRQRGSFLTMVRSLVHATRASDEEAFQLLERHQLWGKGIGWVDAHLLASALISHCRLWTLDQRLAEIAFEIGINKRQRAS
jgi:predicted nucleic acid-binding protein